MGALKNSRYFALRTAEIYRMIYFTQQKQQTCPAPFLPLLLQQLRIFPNLGTLFSQQ